MSYKLMDVELINSSMEHATMLTQQKNATHSTHSQEIVPLVRTIALPFHQAAVSSLLLAQQASLLKELSVFLTSVKLLAPMDYVHHAILLSTRSNQMVVVLSRHVPLP